MGRAAGGLGFLQQSMAYAHLMPGLVLEVPFCDALNGRGICMFFIRALTLKGWLLFWEGWEGVGVFHMQVWCNNLAM